MHKSGINKTRSEIIKQVKNKQPLVKDYSSYILIENCVKKLKKWKKQGATIMYLTSRRTKEQINDIKNVLKRYDFPSGRLFFRRDNEEYKDVAERLMPNILIEDDCESILGIKKMTYLHIKKELQKKIKLIAVKEFEGIDNVPDKI